MIGSHEYFDALLNEGSGHSSTRPSEPSFPRSNVPEICIPMTTLKVIHVHINPSSPSFFDVCNISLKSPPMHHGREEVEARFVIVSQFLRLLEKILSDTLTPSFHSSSNPIQLSDLSTERNELIQPSSSVDTEIFETAASISLHPPPVDRHQSFDEEDFSKKPIVVKKAVPTPKNVASYSIADLQMATGSFGIENLLGKGSFGRVYRAQFDDGKVLAGFEHLRVASNKCHRADDDSKPLIWNSCVKIAQGTARALEYLHEGCLLSVVHKNIKSANILLDVELNPRLSDSVLATFIPNADQVNFRDDVTMSGYGAPEVTMSGHYSLKSDVYGFGVVMLELLTGPQGQDEQSLVRWATPQLQDIDALSRMVDPALNGLYPVKSLSVCRRDRPLCPAGARVSTSDVRSGRSI
ncbi:Protein STRUBBELIG-RECEPTOR FAMILY 6 [Hibiscus syriacus]|uniref:Protein STRUBBELIG-RECEPTOR FAMILY 6 n=1 Tax=Hibiscus syriacus TaxID=106335 RepID=A0A6A3D4S3_HIBSY|nr:Protein STRUBBELIG-RECEPTOR FAMILY 6 [Hibiscus syriacus]